MNLLKRELAPVTENAWREIDAEARRVLRLALTGRQVVDVDGPHGWTMGAVNTGRLDLLDEPLEEGVPAGRRRCLPLAEVRLPVHLPLMELDCVERGAADIDLEPVTRAAERLATVENRAIFSGFDSLQIRGVVPSATIPTERLPESAAAYPDTVSAAREQLQGRGVTGPYALALGPEEFLQLSRADEDGYPARKHVEQVVDGPVVRVASLEGGVLLSLRGGDHVLTLGQDASIGYAAHDRDSVELFLTQSFTFEVRDPGAAVVLARA